VGALLLDSHVQGGNGAPQSAAADSQRLDGGKNLLLQGSISRITVRLAYIAKQGALAQIRRSVHGAAQAHSYKNRRTRLAPGLLDDLPDRFHYGFFSPGGIEHPHRAAVLTAETLEQDAEGEATAFDKIPPDGRRQVVLGIGSVEDRLRNDGTTKICLLDGCLTALHDGGFNASKRKRTGAPHIGKDQEQSGILTHRQAGLFCKLKVLQYCIEYGLCRLTLLLPISSFDQVKHILIKLDYCMHQRVSYSFSEFHQPHPSNSGHTAKAAW